MKKYIVSPVLAVIGDNNIPHFKFGSLQHADRYKKNNSAEIGNGVTIKAEFKRDQIFPKDALKGKASFYNIFYLDSEGVVFIRSFRFGKPGFISIKNLDSSIPVLQFNSKYLSWSSLRVSKTNTVGEHLTDVACLKLIESGFLPLHGGAVEVANRAFLVTALPDIGKTYTILSLLKRGYSFLSEDISIVDSLGSIYSVPYTQTVEKRRKVGHIKRFYRNVYESIFKINLSTGTIFDLDVSTNLSSKADIRGIFILDRGPSSQVTEISKSRAFSIILNINRLEFNYFKNSLILSYIFFNQGMKQIDDYMKSESTLLRQLLDKCKIYLITGPSYSSYTDLIAEIVEGKS